MLVETGEMLRPVQKINFDQVILVKSLEVVKPVGDEVEEDAGGVGRQAGLEDGLV